MARANRETWAKRVQEWKRSGLTAELYAQREGLKANTLRWWSSQLGRAPRTALVPPVVEVVMAGSARVEEVLELLLVGGRRVAVPVGFDEATLRRLLAMLEER